MRCRRLLGPYSLPNKARLQQLATHLPYSNRIDLQLDQEPYSFFQAVLFNISLQKIVKLFDLTY